VLNRDVLLLAPVAKPALLRQLFGVACQAHAEILPYNRMLGQLQDAGNTVTLAHYLELLGAAYLVTGLPRWSPGKVRLRAASPKLVVWNNALVTAMADRGYRDLRGRPDLWGRLVENAVGAHLLAAAATGAVGVHYWREGTDEVDFVLSRGDRLLSARGQKRPAPPCPRPGRVSTPLSEEPNARRRERRRAARGIFRTAGAFLDRVATVSRMGVVRLALLSSPADWEARSTASCYAPEFRDLSAKIRRYSQSQLG
jgi:hypothetical protein